MYACYNNINLCINSDHMHVCNINYKASESYAEEGVIAKINEPAAWCSSDLIREKPNKFRVL